MKNIIVILLFFATISIIPFVAETAGYGSGQSTGPNEQTEQTRGRAYKYGQRRVLFPGVSDPLANIQQVIDGTYPGLPVGQQQPMVGNEWRAVPNTGPVPYTSPAQFTAIMNAAGYASCSAAGSHCFAGTSSDGYRIQAYSGVPYTGADGNYKQCWVGGGHADYGGNEVICWSWKNFVFTREIEPVALTGPNVGAIQPDCYFPQNWPNTGPLATHTYSGSTYNPSDNSIWVSGNSEYCSSSGGGQFYRGADRPWKFSLDSKTWSRINGSTLATDIRFVNSAFNTVTNRWIGRAYNVADNANKGKFVEYDTDGTYHGPIANMQIPNNRPDEYMLSARDKLYILQDNTIKEIFRSDYAESSTDLMTFATGTCGSNPAAEMYCVNSAIGYWAFSYEPSTQRFFFYPGQPVTNGNNIYTLDYNTKEIRRFASGTNHPGGGGYTYNRFFYEPEKGVFLYAKGETGNDPVWIYKPAPASAGTILQAGSAWTEDWATRSTKAGVVKAVSFDDQTEWNTGGGVKDDDDPRDPSKTPIRDTTIKAEGTSSIRFDRVAPGTFTRAGGQYETTLGAKFGEGDTFYIQWQERFNTAFLTKANWQALDDTAPKFMTIWSDVGSSCQDTEISIGNHYGDSTIQGYTHCGSVGITTNLTRTAYSSTLPYLWQQGDDDTHGYNCSHNDYSAMAHGWNNGLYCHFLTPNHWITFYLKVHIVTWNVNNSEISLWISEDGGPYQRVFNNQFMKLELDNTGEKFAYFYAEQYTTHNGTWPDVPNLPTMSNWVDSIIISTQPIAVPRIE